jgi:glycerol-3-phosphate dehydrogenase
VIGGGASGAGCALDAQLRGFKTILVEAGDFGSGTSTASTKLIHGGLRYLRQAVTELDIAQYRFVRQALRERRLMLRNAPHLSEVRRFVVPCFSVLQAIYYGAGLKLYDWLSGDASLSPSHFVRRTESLARMPCLNGQHLYGTLVYSDGQFDDARYNLALVQSCAASGGEVLNYSRVVGFEKNEHGRLVAALLEDRESKQRFKVAAQAFVNATGPFSDDVWHLADGAVKRLLRFSKGSHILLPLPDDFGSDALLIPKTEDDRVIFAIPWLGRLLVGTTDTNATLDSEMIVTREEAEFLLRHLNRYLARQFAVADIVSAMAGLRPLLQSRGSRDTKKLSRDYEITIDTENGLINVFGGKWTVYRAMAEDAINAVERSLRGRITECPTRHHLLFGVEENSMSTIEDTMRHLTLKFGRMKTCILDLAHEDTSLLSPIIDGAPPIQAEVVYCAREEMAVCIEDILSRRLGLQYFDWRLAIQAAPVVGQILTKELGWPQTRTLEETARYIGRINRFLEALGLEPVRAVGSM